MDRLTGEQYCRAGCAGKYTYVDVGIFGNSLATLAVIPCSLYPFFSTCLLVLTPLSFPSDRAPVSPRSPGDRSHLGRFVHLTDVSVRLHKHRVHPSAGRQSAGAALRAGVSTTGDGGSTGGDGAPALRRPPPPHARSECVPLGAGQHRALQPVCAGEWWGSEGGVEMG